MNDQGSPFRILAKTYISEVISREQYLQVRSQLLTKLEDKGQVDIADLNRFSAFSYDNESPPSVEKTYSVTDWVIIVLGLSASVILAFILYG